MPAKWTPRVQPTPSQNRQESIPETLARLRREDAYAQRNARRAEWPDFISFFLRKPEASAEVLSHTPSEADLQTRRNQIQESRKFVSYATRTGDWSEMTTTLNTDVPTLKELCTKVMIDDLNGKAMLKRAICYLSVDERIEVADYASLYRPLSENALRLLLLQPSKTGSVTDCKMSIIKNGSSTWEEELWDNDRFMTIPGNILTCLDLSYTSLSVKTLCQLFFGASEPVAPTSNFPSLSTLLLVCIPIPFDYQFFNLISHIVSLRHLSLAHNLLQQETCHQLALVTPGLVTLDLSYCANLHPGFFHQNWDTRWKYLKVLGLKRLVTNEDGEHLADEIRERVKLCQKPRYIEIIV